MFFLYTQFRLGQLGGQNHLLQFVERISKKKRDTIKIYGDYGKPNRIFAHLKLPSRPAPRISSTFPIVFRR